MSLRILGSLLLVLFATVRLPITSAGGQATEGPFIVSNWEYEVVRLDPVRCSTEEVLTSALNEMGRKGWELVSYERLTPLFPNAEGTILMRPAATGVGRNTSPQLADSFQGTITMKTAQAQAERLVCRVMFKRLMPSKP